MYKFNFYESCLTSVFEFVPYEVFIKISRKCPKCDKKKFYYEHSKKRLGRKSNMSVKLILELEEIILYLYLEWQQAETSADEHHR